MPAPRLYVLCGTDRARKLSRAQELVRALAVELIDQHRVSGVSLRIDELAGLLREPPLMSASRLIVMTEAQALDEACTAHLLEDLRTSASSAHLVLFVDEELERASPWQALGPQAVVERFASPAPAFSGFEVVNAIARRDAVAALTGLRDQLADGKELLEVVGLLGWQLQRWLLVKRGGDASLQPWQLERLRGEVASRSVESLQRSVRRVWEVDVAAKQGRLPSPRAAVDALVVELCRG
jgi:DNA polymerase III delta subunit